MMRVLVTGSAGQVGHELIRLAPEGFQVLGCSSAELDITDATAVTEATARFAPQLIINAAAYTAVDRAETDAERAYAVNRDGIANLARQQVPLLHISTDYVFAGDATRAYTESDTTAPNGVYGASKLAGEQVLRAENARHIILRTAWVFGAHGNNFVKTMLRLGQEREELSVVADQTGGPTSATSIARTLWSLAAQYRETGNLHWGTYHFCGAPACTWHEFAQAIFHEAHASGLLQREPLVHAITTADYPTPARRPAWSVLDCSKLRETYSIPQPNWRQELKQVLDNLQ